MSSPRLQHHVFLEFQQKHQQVAAACDELKRVRRRAINEGFVAGCQLCRCSYRAVDRSIDRLLSATQRRIIGFYVLVDTRRMVADFAPSLLVLVMGSPLGIARDARGVSLCRAALSRLRIRTVYSLHASLQASGVYRLMELISLCCSLHY